MRFTIAMAAMLAVAGVAPAQMQLLVPMTSTPATTSAEGVMTKAKKPTEAEARAREFRVPQVKGRKLLRAVSKVTRELKWHKKLDTAVDEAQKTGKPILWIQALGDLKGYT